LTVPRLRHSGKRCVIIAIDYFTKWVEAMAMKTQGSVETAAFLTGIIDRFGAPAIIRTDKGTHFQLEFVKVLAANLVDHHVSRAYHPQSNDLMERSGQTIAGALKRTVGGQGNIMAQGWASKLPSVVRGYNMSTQASTTQSMTELERENQEIVTAADNLRYLSSSEELGLSQRQDQIELAERTRAQAGANIQAAQKRQATNYNSHNP